MKILSLKFILITLFLFSILYSCRKNEDFKSLNYRSGGFGTNDYHLILNKNRLFSLEIEHNPLDEIVDSAKIGKFKGELSESRMLQLQKAIATITTKGYDYHDPELVFDAGIYEIVVNTDTSTKIFKTNHATDNFRKDIIELLDEICENDPKFKVK
ncbi:hypothetical protein [Chryseobacterium sp. 5_R23647]|uniref:hypothetical protein n=1 Tax=Chryseobacterium TaxID=59732 RepID=UPI000E24D9EC|nr:hypothetical protein [Chryseobacterium sp. 5_R23647]REC41086.1 hypothetical protein DRF69_16125 [Chryseobacterium sp. 5_R23647]